MAVYKNIKKQSSSKTNTAKSPPPTKAKKRQVKLQNMPSAEALEVAERRELAKVAELQREKSLYSQGTSEKMKLPLYARSVRSVSRGVSSEFEAVKNRLEGTIGESAGKKMALANVLPHAHQARYTAGWSTTPTSVASPFVITTVDFSAAPATGLTYPAELGAGAFFAGVSRDPLCAIVEYVPNVGKLGLEYEAHFCSYDDLTSRTPVVRTTQRMDPAVNTSHVLSINFWQDIQPGSTTHVHPHGPRMYARTSPKDALFRFSYLTKGQTVNFNFQDESGVGLALTGHIGVVRANGDSMTEVPGEAIVSSTFVNVQCPESGFYAFVMAWSAAPGPPAIVQVGARMIDLPGAAAIGSYLGHRPIPGIEDRNLLAGIRVNGCSIMITPDSVELAKGGRITGAQTDTGFEIESVVTNAAGQDPNALLDNIPGSKGIDFSKGGYAFHKPRTQASFEKRIPFKHNGDYVPRAVFGNDSPQNTVSSYTSDLLVPDGWLAYAVTTPPNVVGATTTPYPGGIVHVTYSFSVEYWHYDIWIGTKLPALGTAGFDDIMSLIATAPQFHENPLHVADLKRWYNGAMPVLRKLGPGVKDLLTMLFPQAAPGLMMMETIGSMLPESV